jgi:hypothetical protein
MQRPKTVVLAWESLGEFRNLFQTNATVSQLTAVGRRMASLLFPDDVMGLLTRSLAGCGKIPRDRELL